MGQDDPIFRQCDVGLDFGEQEFRNHPMDGQVADRFEQSGVQVVGVAMGQQDEIKPG